MKQLVLDLLGISAGGIAGGVFGFVIGMLINALAFIYGKAKSYKVAIFSNPIILKAEDLAFLDKEDALLTLQLIGKGGCGEVYKADLPNTNGKKIAVKKINLPANETATELNDQQPTKMLSKKERQIRAEIQTIGRIQHRNLLPLLAHVTRPQCHYLVYEYMKNGSLEDIIEGIVSSVNFGNY